MNTEEISVWFAQLFQLGEQPEWQELSVSGHRMALFSYGELATAVTVDASAIDTGLRAMAPPEAANPLSEADIRVELIAQTTPTHREQLPTVIEQALARMSDDSQETAPQPGTILADLVPELSTRHGLLVAPQLWEQGVPHLWEEPEQTRRSHGQLTLPLQLLLLTTEELEYAITYSVEELQEQMPIQGIDVHEWNR
ncbi:suppressor of fused domain protein [Corynebacterium ciconiae]|uniref:suppressor of fused domain protein n=1 Tax=Corynebacterium ciconiae TaxID=227319 RepID=UPI000371EA34|nr:suppressor of fused domain protein [Corynebacterium ciconiae]